MDAMLLTTSMSSPILNCQKLKRTFQWNSFCERCERSRLVCYSKWHWDRIWKLSAYNKHLIDKYASLEKLMKKEKKTTETLGSQGNQKINQKEKDTNNYWKRKTEIFKLKNKLLQPTTSQKKKKKKKKTSITTNICLKMTRKTVEQ